MATGGPLPAVTDDVEQPARVNVGSNRSSTTCFRPRLANRSTLVMTFSSWLSRLRVRDSAADTGTRQDTFERAFQAFCAAKRSRTVPSRVTERRARRQSGGADERRRHGLRPAQRAGQVRCFGRSRDDLPVKGPPTVTRRRCPMGARAATDHQGQSMSVVPVRTSRWEGAPRQQLTQRSAEAVTPVHEGARYSASTVTRSGEGQVPSRRPQRHAPRSSSRCFLEAHGPSQHCSLWPRRNCRRSTAARAHRAGRPAVR